MARGRMISRTLGGSEKFAALGRQVGKLGEFAQVLYPLIVANTDDYGRLKGSAQSIKWACFPSSPRPVEDFEQALTAMETVGLIQRYKPNGDQIVQILCFDEHQPGLHKRTAPKLPPPPESPGNDGNFPDTPGTSGLARARGTEQNRTEGKGTEGKAPAPTGGFAAFWTTYPRKVAKGAAEVAWRKGGCEALTAVIVAAVERQKTWPDWQKDGGQFIPHPATWLNQRRWEDEPRQATGPPLTEKHRHLKEAGERFLRGEDG